MQVTFFSNLRGLNVTQPVYNGFPLYDRQAELIVFQAPCTNCSYKLGEILFYLYFTEAVPPPPQPVPVIGESQHGAAGIRRSDAACANP